MVGFCCAPVRAACCQISTEPPRVYLDATAVSAAAAAAKAGATVKVAPRLDELGWGEEGFLLAKKDAGSGALHSGRSRGCLAMNRLDGANEPDAEVFPTSVRTNKSVAGIATEKRALSQQAEADAGRLPTLLPPTEELRGPEAAVQRELAAFLQEHGFASVGAKRRRGVTSMFPLHVAVEQRDSYMVRLLLLAGADPQRRNSWGRTPLQLARRLDRDGSHRLVLHVLMGTAEEEGPI